MKTAKQLIESIEIEDAAFDYVEKVVGRLDFSANWCSWRGRTNIIEELKRWMITEGYDPSNAENLFAKLEELYNNKCTWDR